MRSNSPRQNNIDRVVALIQDDVSETPLERKFLIWATELYLAAYDAQPSSEDLLENITDGKDDLEVDAYLEDDENKAVYLFQSKFRSKPGNLSKEGCRGFSGRAFEAVLT